VGNTTICRHFVVARRSWTVARLYRRCPMVLPQTTELADLQVFSGE
jgi:hypothetical protein